MSTDETKLPYLLSGKSYVLVVNLWIFEYCGLNHSRSSGGCREGEVLTSIGDVLFTPLWFNWNRIIPIRIIHRITGMIASGLAGRFVQLAPKPVAEHRSANGDEFPVWAAVRRYPYNGTSRLGISAWRKSMYTCSYAAIGCVDFRKIKKPLQN